MVHEGGLAQEQEQKKKASKEESKTWYYRISVNVCDGNGACGSCNSNKGALIHGME